MKDFDEFDREQEKIEDEPAAEPVNEAPANETEETAEPAADVVTEEILSENRTETAEPTEPAAEPTPAPNYTANPAPAAGYAYRPAQSGQPQNAYSPYPNGYTQTAHNPYNAYAASANRSASGISYSPAPKKKEKRSSAVRTVALICCLCVVLSGLCGFGGALLANRMSRPADTATAPSPASQNGEASAVNPGEPVVIYRSVDSVATSTSTTAGEDLTYAQVAAIVKDSVVEINTEYTVRSSWFQYTTKGAGSGVIISEDGYLITNAHVITDDEGDDIADSIVVRLTNGEEYQASAIAYDTEEDIALLKIDAAGLTPARCGNSDKLVVGEELVIVGNPLGKLGGSVSNGIVSATERKIQVEGVTMHLIQTNAAVNPGNSGGGMFNMKGELIGIVNAKSWGTEIEGLGFAIPINQALNVAEQLLTYGYVRGKPTVGAIFEDINASNYFFYYSVKSGVYVTRLLDGYNEDVLKVGDRIIAVNGKEITSSDDIRTIVSGSAIGDKLTFQLYRDNKLKEVEVTCYEQVPESNANIRFSADDAAETPQWFEDFSASEGRPSGR